jgi:hypothetical protein
VPDPGSAFAGWQWDCDAPQDEITVTVADDTYCKARFVTRTTRTLDVTVNGPGRVTSAPAGIDCGSDCREDYALNTEVTLTATAEGGSTFQGWSGDPDCLDGNVFLSDDVACTATFEAVATSYDVSITWDAEGAVQVGGDAVVDTTTATAWSGTISAGGRLELTASDPDPGDDIVFLGWEDTPGCPLGGTVENPGTIDPVDRDIACQANFGVPPNACGDVSGAAVSFTVDGTPFDQFPDNSGSGNPSVYDAPSPDAIALAAQVSGFPAAQATFQWEFQPFLAGGSPTWQSIAECSVTSTSCTWDGTDEFFPGGTDPVSAARVRLRVQGCAGAVDLETGPTADINGGPAYVDVFP